MLDDALTAGVSSPRAPADQTATCPRSARRLVSRLLVVGSLLSCASAAPAHDFWIEPDRFWIAPGQPAALSLLVGHGPAKQRWVLRLNRVVSLLSIAPHGRRTDHAHVLRQGTYAPDPQLSFRQPGVHVVAFENTAVTNVLPPIRFEQYLEEEGLTPAIVWRRRMGTTGQPGRERYSRRAKTLVQIGPSNSRSGLAVTRPLGLTLEIVPLINPYSPGRTTALPLAVMYNGRPLPGALVKLTDLNADAKPVETHVTDRAGLAAFRLPRSGRWQFNVVWTKPLQREPDADFETVFSSLTFGFAGAAK